MSRRRALAALLALTGCLLGPAPGALAAPTDDGRSVVLAIDASGSMAGERMSAARAAAEAFVAALPADVAVGVVAFADRPTVALAPTDDREAVRASIARIRPDGDTALRDGLIAALPIGARVVVLSDGEDTASRASATALDATIRASGIPVDVVALAPSREHAADLRGIAERSGGAYASAAQASDLASAFATVAEAMSAAPTDAAGLAASGGASASGSTSVDARAPLGSAATPPAVTPTRSTTWLPWIAALATSLAVTLLLVGLLSLRASRRRHAGVERAIRAYGASGDPSSMPDPVVPERASGVRIADLDARVQGRHWHGRLAEQLELAGIRWSPVAWLALTTLVTLAIAEAIAIVSGTPVLGLIAGVAVALAFRQAVRWRVNAAVRAFDAELPDLLLLLASAMRSGLSFAQALEATAVGAGGEAGRQLRRAVGETRLGTPVEEALTRAAVRVRSDDLRWTVQALAMQRQVGGNLSTILETAAASVRGRAELRREIRTLSAEGRLSAAILIGLPVALFAFLVVTRRDYVDFFWTQALGVAVLLVLLVLGAVGALWIRSIVRIEA